MKQLSMYETDYLDHLKHQDDLSRLALSAIPPCLPNREKAKTCSIQANKPKANVTEIIIAKDKVDSIQLLLPMLTKLNQDKRWLAWIDPPIQLLKEWQTNHHELATEEIMILRSSESNSAFQLSKKALEAGTCHAVIAWTNVLNNEEFSQLEKASSLGNSHGIILRIR